VQQAYKLRSNPFMEPTSTKQNGENIACPRKQHEPQNPTRYPMRHAAQILNEY